MFNVHSVGHMIPVALPEAGGIMKNRRNTMSKLILLTVNGISVVCLGIAQRVEEHQTSGSAPACLLKYLTDGRKHLQHSTFEYC